MAAPERAGGGSAVPAEDSRASRFTTYAFRAAGLILVALVVFPVYRLLDGPDVGPFLRGSLNSAEDSRTLLFLGSLIVVAMGVVLSRVIDPRAIERVLTRAAATLVSIPTGWFAGGLALIAATLTLAISHFVLEGKPNLIDAMVQLVHAKYIAAGQLAGPADEFLEFWQLQNSLVTPNGWVSQYPPGYLVFLAAGLRLGVVQLVGPFFVGIAVLFTALAAERLLREDRATARLGALLLCFSPFVMGLAAAYMNHIGATAFSAAAIYFAVRSTDEGLHRWALLSGTATGLVFSIRPLSAVVAATVVALVWLLRDSDTPGRVGRFVRRTLSTVVGIAPILVAIGLYNRHFFGSPLTFGYVASQGPLVGPGFHRDPTGALYTPVKAIGYTSSDLVTLSLYLLETPIPVVIVAGLFFLLANRFSVGVRIVALWALLPVAANALYWHHGLFMGPRMLNESAAPWALLTAIGAVGLVRMIPRETVWGNYSPRMALTLTFALSWLAGLVYLGPQRLLYYGGPWMESSRVEVPPLKAPSLVFVHGAWTGRIAMRLVANGMRLDSLEAAMRQNPTCDTHNYARWYSAGPDRAPQPPALDFSFERERDNAPPPVTISTGNNIRKWAGIPLSAECQREVASDTLGIVDVGPLVWQGDLPGLGENGPMFVRDMGPEANARLIRKYPNRTPAVLLRPVDDGPPKLVPYDEGMKTLWNTPQG